MNRDHGFTLIEMIVTLMVVGIMAIAVLPRMDMLRGFDEIGFRDKLIATLEYARKSAVAARRDVRVEIAANSVTVTRQNATPEGEGVAGFSPLNLPGANSHTFATPANLTLVPVTVTFDPLGRSAGASIAVSGAGTITVVAETGYVY